MAENEKKMTVEDFLKSTGLDMSISYEDFNEQHAKDILLAAIEKLEERENTIQDIEAIKKAVFMFVNIINLLVETKT